MANKKRGILLRFYKKVSGVLFILAALYCLPKSGLIAWRNQKDHHLIYLYHLLKDALDQNHVKRGFLALKDEFLFQFTLGNIIKFLILCCIVMAIILLLPKAFELLRKLAKVPSFRSEHCVELYSRFHKCICSPIWSAC